MLLKAIHQICFGKPPEDEDEYVRELRRQEEEKRRLAAKEKALNASGGGFRQVLTFPRHVSLDAETKTTNDIVKHLQGTSV